MNQLLTRINTLLSCDLTISGYTSTPSDSTGDKPARVLNNKIKQYLLSQYTSTGNAFLDLPCGSGNDIAKLTGIGISKYVGIDLDYNDFLLNVAKSRPAVTQMQDNCDFFKKDMCADNLLQGLGIELNSFDVVSCQFALHYSFEKEKTANAFIKNVSSALKHGGKFIATFPSGEYLLDKWKNTKSNGCKLESKYFCVTFPAKPPPETIGFGEKYHFQLGESVNDYEFFVDTTNLQTICRRNGLTLIDNVDFESFCTENKLSGNPSMHELKAEIVNGYTQLDQPNRDVINIYKYMVFQKA